MKKRVLCNRICVATVAIALSAVTLTGCGEMTADKSDVKANEKFTERDLSGEYEEAESIRIALSGDSASCDSDAVQINGSTVTISAEGTYILSGALKEGMLIVEAEDSAKVQLVLAGVEITNSTNAAIYAKQADKVFVTLADGAENVLSSGGYTEIDDNNIDACIFSKCDLTINGTGSLIVNAEEGHGIVSKDDLKLAGGSLTVTAEKHGLSGKDSVCIADGALDVSSGKDGIHSENTDDTEKGYVYLAGGTLTVNAEGDGISAGAFLQIDGGDFRLASGDDGVHAGENVLITGGNITISTCYEGIEGNSVEISGGYVSLYATDDGINAVGGNDESGFGGRFDRDSFDNAAGMASEHTILISGGKLLVNAEGDGIDSNGSFVMTGGEAYISGPTNGGNGALDYDGTGRITGGTIVALGMAQMALNFSDASTQGSILITTAECPAGTEVVLKDASGAKLVSYTAEKAFNCVVVSCPELVQGETYTVSAGGEDTTVTLDSLIYGNGSGMGGFGEAPDAGRMEKKQRYN